MKLSAGVRKQRWWACPPLGRDADPYVASVAPGSGVDLDLGCVETITRPPFLVDAESFRDYVAETLAPMAE